MKTKLILALLSSSLILSACGKKDTQVEATKTSSQLALGTIIEKVGSNGDWKIIERQSREGDVYYKSESLPMEKADENARKEYKDTQMNKEGKKKKKKKSNKTKKRFSPFSAAPRASTSSPPGSSPARRP